MYFKSLNALNKVKNRTNKFQHGSDNFANTHAISDLLFMRMSRKASCDISHLLPFVRTEGTDLNHKHPPDTVGGGQSSS